MSTITNIHLLWLHFIIIIIIIYLLIIIKSAGGHTAWVGAYFMLAYSRKGFEIL